MPEKYKKTYIGYLIFSMLLFIVFIILSEGKFISKKTLFEKDYNTKINLYILKDGCVHVEQNIKVNSSNYSTYFFSDLPSRFNEYDYNQNVQNLKVYYNDNQLTSTEGEDGYFNYRYCTNITTKIIDPKFVESDFSSELFNNIEIFLPKQYGNLKIVYDLENYIANYNDINYIEYDLKYDYNIFDDDVQINIIMPEITNKFLVNTNLEFSHSSITSSLNDTTKQISISGLKDYPLHMEVLFDRKISDSSLKFNKDNYKYLSKKFKQDRKDRIESYVVIFILLFFASIAVTSSFFLRFLHRYR